MSDDRNPIVAGFELQRRAIEASQEALTESVELQRRFGEALLEGVETTEDVQRRGVETSRNGLHAYLDAIEATMPGSEEAVSEIRETADEQFDTLEDRHAEAFETVGEELEDGTDTYAELTTESLESLTENLDAVLDTHEAVEAQTLEALERTESQFEELRTEFEAGDLPAGMDAEVFGERFEKQLKRFRTQLSELEERVETTQQEFFDASE